MSGNQAQNQNQTQAANNQKPDKSQVSGGVIRVGDVVYKYPDHMLTASQVEAMLERLKEPFADDELQFASASETKKGYDAEGVIPQKVVDRVNEVVGMTHINEAHELLDRTEKPTKSGNMHEVTYKVVIQIGNWFTIFTPDGQVKTGFEVLAERYGYGTHAAYTLGDAIKSAVTNAKKKAWSGYSVGGHAYQKKKGNQGGGNQYRSENNKYDSRVGNQRRSYGPNNQPNQGQQPPGRQPGSGPQTTGNQQGQQTGQTSSGQVGSNTSQMVNSLAKIVSGLQEGTNADKVVFRFKAGVKQANGAVCTVQTTPMTPEAAENFKRFLAQYGKQELLLRGYLHGDVVICNNLLLPQQTQSAG